MKDHPIRTMNEFEGKTLLKEWGIPVIDEAVAEDENRAVLKARTLGYPVALKVCSDAVPHKTES